MGQKVNPNSFRLGTVNTWSSVWYARGQEYTDKLHQDLTVRNIVNKKLKVAGISNVKIERQAQKVIVTVYAARPGVAIGKKGGDLESLKTDLSKVVGPDLSINITEVKKPELSAKLVGENVARQLENRVSFRKAVKKAMQSSMRMGAKGVRIAVSGRLGGAEIARTEWYREGRVPLHTLRADIEFAIVEAHTTYGVIGVKVWIYRQDLIAKKN